MSGSSPGQFYPGSGLNPTPGSHIHVPSPNVNASLHGGMQTSFVSTEMSSQNLNSISYPGPYISDLYSSWGSASSRGSNYSGMVERVPSTYFTNSSYPSTSPMSMPIQHRRQPHPTRSEEGVGLRLSVAGGLSFPIITAVERGGSAEACKRIRAGDFLTGIEGHSTEAKTLATVRSLIIGPSGSFVNLNFSGREGFYTCNLARGRQTTESSGRGTPTSTGSERPAGAYYSGTAPSASVSSPFQALSQSSRSSIPQSPRWSSGGLPSVHERKRAQDSGTMLSTAQWVAATSSPLTSASMLAPGHGWRIKAGDEQTPRNEGEQFGEMDIKLGENSELRTSEYQRNDQKKIGHLTSAASGSLGRGDIGTRKLTGVAEVRMKKKSRAKGAPPLYEHAGRVLEKVRKEPEAVVAAFASKDMSLNEFSSVQSSVRPMRERALNTADDSFDGDQVRTMSKPVTSNHQFHPKMMIEARPQPNHEETIRLSADQTSMKGVDEIASRNFMSAHHVFDDVGFPLTDAVRKKQLDEEMAKKESEEKYQRGAAENAIWLAQEKLKKEIEERTVLEALNRARMLAEREAEEKAVKEAEEAMNARKKTLVDEEVKMQAERILRSATEELLRRDEEEKRRGEAEAMAHREALEKARKEAEEKSKKEAEEKVRLEAAERKAAEDKAKREKEEKLMKEAEEKAKREALEKARKEAEEARKRADDEAKMRAEETLRREAEEKAKAAQEKLRIEAEERAKAAEAEAKRVEEEKLIKEAEAKAHREALEKARKEAEEKSKKEAEEKVRLEAAERKAAEEKAQKGAGALEVAGNGSLTDATAQNVAEVKTKHESEDKVNSEKEDRMKRKADEKERKEAELKRKKDQRKSRKAAEKKEKREKKEAEDKADMEAKGQLMVSIKDGTDVVAKTEISALPVAEKSPEKQESELRHAGENSGANAPIMMEASAELPNPLQKPADDRSKQKAGSAALPSVPSAAALRQQLEVVHRLQIQVDKVMQAERLAARAQEIKNRMRLATASAASLTKAKHGSGS